MCFVIQNLLPCSGFQIYTEQHVSAVCDMSLYGGLKWYFFCVFCLESCCEDALDVILYVISIQMYIA